MTLGSILLSVALLVVVGTFIARPVLLRQLTPTAKPQTPRQALLAQKEALLEQIRTLEFDYETGKVTEADYQAERQSLVVQAAEALQGLDQLNASSTVDDEIESAIASLRQTTTEPKAIEPVPPEATTAPKATKQAKFCHQCGEKRDTNDKFCAYCGTSFRDQGSGIGD